MTEHAAQLKNFTVKSILQRGFEYVLICLIAGYFYTEMNTLKTDLSDIRMKQEEYNKTDRIVILNALNASTDALNNYPCK